MGLGALWGLTGAGPWEQLPRELAESPRKVLMGYGPDPRPSSRLPIRTARNVAHGCYTEQLVLEPSKTCPSEATLPERLVVASTPPLYP